MKRDLQQILFSVAFLLLSGLTIGAFAQERQVSGKVTDENGSSLPGVSILVKGTTNGTVTDVNGSFSLSVSNNGTLVFSFVGYTTQEVAVGSSSSINVTLQPDLVELQEIVVTGYAVQNKKDLTGSVGIVNAEELNAVPTGNVTKQLQGRVAGVSVVGSGQPGESSRVRIRGIGSFGGNDPLYVVDGIPTTDASTLNPNDVASVSVLKDAGAASIYGSRANNGVIIITTKSGSEGVKVNYSMYTGTQNPGTGPANLLNSQGMADLIWLVYDNDGTKGTETHPYLGDSGNASPTLPSWDGNTNWWEAITSSASMTSHDLSLSGGNQNAKFFSSLNYFDQNGIINTTYSKRFSARFNSSFNIKDRVTLGENLQVSYTTGNTIANQDEGNAISMVYRTMPFVPVKMTTDFNGTNHNFVVGDWGGTGIAPRLGNAANAAADLERNKDDQSFGLRMLGSTYLDAKILDNLSFRSTFGGSYSSWYYSNFNFATYERSENISTPTLSEGGGWASDWNWTNAFTYDLSTEGHDLKLVAGYEALKFDMGRTVNVTAAGYYSNDISFRTISNGESIAAASSGIFNSRAMVSQFARADYIYSGKYLLSTTVRRDGVSVFSGDNQYAVFPSVSLGWRISDEAFLEGNPVVSELKLRGGWGTMGNQGAVDPANAFALFRSQVDIANYDIGGTGNSSAQGFFPATIANPDAKWEGQSTINFGIDAGLLDNKLEVVLDLYDRTTNGLLFDDQIPGALGSATAPKINIGSIQNKGIDLQIIYRQNFSSDMNFEANATISSVNTEIVKLAEGVDEFYSGDSRIVDITINRVGDAPSSFFGYEVVGLFQDAAEVSAAATQDGAAPGFFRYRDVNEDGVITPEDRTVLGNPNPDFTYGLNLSLNYKNFDVTAFIFGSKGGELYNYTKWWTDFFQSFQGQKSTALLNDSWTPENPNATVPKASNDANFSNNQTVNSYYVEDASYLRLKNLQVGYTFPKSQISSLGLENARVYVQGINLFTLTKYSGLDPELGGWDGATGIDYGNYPNVSQLLLGLNIGF